jgi:tellurite resistance protein/RecA/RadA recombinase
MIKLDIESIRVPHERTYAARVEQHPLCGALVSQLVPADAKEVRRRLMANSLRLTESMAPEAHRVAREAQRVLGIAGDLEVYQRSGAENAAIHLVETPILLEIQGALLPRLDGPAMLGLFGHELGHYLAHGPTSPIRRALTVMPALGRVDDRSLELPLSRLSMVAELTADRVGLVACQDLGAMLRLEMVTLTGLSSGELTWDTGAYLAQCRELIESGLREGANVRGVTHPEHSLRAYALWLFSETRTYRALTGHGPGTRELAEVDATIARCFGPVDADPAGELGLDYSQLGEPPRELHECALAAAVIVAFADGELADEEREAIERQFAMLVPDWQTYLELPLALERFRETAAVLGAAGRDLTRPLFHVLVHVMGADGAVHADELAMILAVGRVLGVEHDYRRGLAVVLETLGTSPNLGDLGALAELPPAELPLPARRKDVEDAFATFRGGVRRRGESTITLRRLLRLLGADRRTEALVDQITRTFQADGIETSIELAGAHLDERIVLTAKAPPTPPPAPAALPASRTALIGALRRLREQLVSGDGRSPSVRLRQLRRGRAFDLMALDGVSIGMAERVLAQVVARKLARLVDAADAGRHGPAGAVSAELLALAREDAQRAEETGAHDLYLGYPFITGNVDGYPVRAPMVLYPIELERDGDGARGYRMQPRRDDAAIANQSLIRLIFHKRGFAFSDELSDELEELAGAPDGGHEAVRKKLAEVGLETRTTATALQAFRERDTELLAQPNVLELEEVAVVGLFPQSSSDLLQDYDGLLKELTEPRADVATLLAAASTLLPEGMAGPSRIPADASLATDWAPVIPADPSQRSVIAECRRQGATVVDGPPGTGKSQVIVNLVAEALRRGERVAVVCEKRAALDVVRQRLAAIGFGKALAVVHDVNEDRKSLFAHIAQRIETRERIPFSAEEAAQVGAEHERVHRALGERAAELRASAPGLELTLGELLTYAASQPRTLPRIAGLDHLPQAQLRTLLDVTVALHPLAELWRTESRWRVTSHGRIRPSLAGLHPSAVRDLGPALDRAIAAAQRYEAQVHATPVSLDAVEHARPALALAAQTRAVRTDDHARALFGALATVAAQQPARLAEATGASRAWQEASTAMVRLEHPVRVEAGPELLVAISVLTRWASAWHRVFVPAWWKARATLRRELTRLWPERAGAAITPALLDELRDQLTASRAWAAITGAFGQLGLAHLLPATARELGPTIDRVSALADRVRELGAAQPVLAAAGAWLSPGAGARDDFARWDHAIDQRLALLAARDALASAAAPLTATFPWLDPLPRADALGQLRDAWQRDGIRLVEADTLIARATQILPSALALFDAALEAWRDQPSAAWRTGVTAAWAAAWLDRLERERPALARLGLGADDREIDRLATRLRELENDRRDFEIERTLARIDDTELLNLEAASKHQRRTPQQKLREELLKEARKQRMRMPLRTFVRRFAPQGLLDVVPTWLLSPETMAVLFPRQPLFDLVVFDEASQCTVESGLPVLLRARRVVIAGDEKQMPPSSYFAMGGEDDEEIATSASEPDREVLRDLLTAESLLALARPRVAHTGLDWHYRCRDEALIAFSNHAMYDGELRTIPSTAGAAAPSAIRWVAVPDGVYAGGENAPEARRVVDVVDELLGRARPPSIGVVTFNLKQRRAVLDAIDARAAADPAFRERWTAAASQDRLDERPFVKNLEQVQGDERDVIVFSLGHAPQVRRRQGVATDELYVPARFGPLGQRGGERRLNVAISRAKAECYVVASFEPSLLTVASSRHQGPRLFKHFLEFSHHLHHNRRLEAARVLDIVRSSARGTAAAHARAPIEGFIPLQTQVALALEAAGIPHEPDIGASEFRVSIAILDPADPARYALALLLDDPTQPADPFDLHVHRPGVLAQRAWQVLTITAASWYRRSHEILDEIAALVPGCRGAVHNEAYVRHREQARRRPVTTGVSTPTLAVAVTRVGSLATGSMEGPTVAPVDDVASAPVTAPPEPPPWTEAIEDPLFRKALVHLERHSVLGEGELTTMVGGPRRARLFTRELDRWQPGLPFRVEISEIGGAKVYRVAGLQ